jgi:iron complex transport system substrate-binding protein
MRLVSLTCSNTEIVAALGCIDQLVAVDDHSDWPPAIADLQRVGPDLQIDLDAVEALKPDLVLASLTVPGHERIVEGLETRGIPFLAPEPTSLSDVARDIRAIGSAIGVEARADDVARRFEEAMEPVEPVADPVRIGVEWWPKPVYVPGRHSWVTGLLERAGAVNPFADHPDGHDAKSFAVTPEDAVAADLEAVVISWCGVPEDKYRPRIVRSRPGWASVPAVAADRIVPISEAWLGRPGPRLTEGLAALRAVVASVRAAREAP